MSYTTSENRVFPGSTDQDIAVPSSRIDPSASIAREAHETVTSLARDLIAGDVATRQAAAKRILQLGPTPDLIDPLIVALEDPDWLVRMWSADALARAGRGAARAEDALRRRWTDHVVYVRIASLIALNAIRR